MSTSRGPRQSNVLHRSINRSTSTPLPPYQPPAHPLNVNAQRALHNLPRTHRVDGLQTHLSQAITSLTAAAGDINDRSQQRIASHQKRKARREGREGGPDGPGGAQGAEEDELNESNRAAEQMQETVAEMTADLEQLVRKIVDAKANVDHTTTVLSEIDANVSSNGQGIVAPTQSTLGASQLREKKRRRPHVDLSDEEEEEDGDEGTLAAGPAGPLNVFKRKTAEFASEYENSSMRNR